MHLLCNHRPSNRLLRHNRCRSRRCRSNPQVRNHVVVRNRIHMNRNSHRIRTKNCRKQRVSHNPVDRLDCLPGHCRYRHHSTSASRAFHPYYPGSHWSNSRSPRPWCKFHHNYTDRVLVLHLHQFRLHTEKHEGPGRVVTLPGSWC